MTIDKSVTAPIQALGLTADRACVFAILDGVYIYDLYDGDRLVAMARYSTPANAPFGLTDAEIVALTAVPDETEAGDSL